MSGCQMCAKVWRKNRADQGQYPIRHYPASFIYADGALKPLSDASLCFNTCVILRADNTSRLIEEYVRMFLRRYSSQRLPPKQVELSTSAQVLAWGNADPSAALLKRSIAGTDKD